MPLIGMSVRGCCTICCGPQAEVDCSGAQVEELQQQVRVLQAVWAIEGDEDGRASNLGNSNADAGGRGAASSLEAALLAKCRRLEHELTMARLRIGKLSGAPALWQGVSTVRCPFHDCSCCWRVGAGCLVAV